MLIYSESWARNTKIMIFPRGQCDLSTHKSKIICFILILFLCAITVNLLHRQAAKRSITNTLTVESPLIQFGWKLKTGEEAGHMVFTDSYSDRRMQRTFLEWHVHRNVWAVWLIFRLPARSNCKIRKTLCNLALEMWERKNSMKWIQIRSSPRGSLARKFIGSISVTQCNSVHISLTAPKPQNTGSGTEL